MKILIFGANFNNKGAQAMLFVALNEIYSRQPEAKVYLASSDDIDTDNYTFTSVYSNRVIKKAIVSEKWGSFTIKAIIKDVAKYCAGKKSNLWRFNELKKILPEIDMIFDMSGYSIGSKWSVKIQENYLDNIRIAKKYRIPMYLMPQSFGPFDYSDDKKYLLKEIKNLFRYPILVFTREQEGYEQLKNMFSLENIELSDDMVLQNKEINPSYVFKHEHKLEYPAILSEGAVAIIPNKQCFGHGNEEAMYNMYTIIIKHLISMGKKVFICRHSKEDKTVCNEIIKLCEDERVILIDRDFDCIEYSKFISQFDFIICSRYHGLVNAYKESVPAIALGWANKYIQLAHRLGQDRYVFNISEKMPEFDQITDAISTLDSCLREERECIQKKLEIIQAENCFNKVFGSK